MNKISIIGAGATGATTAQWLAQKQIGNIVLVDKNKGIAEGKALDLTQAMAVVGSNITLTGSDDYSITQNSDVVIITAGVPRSPGMDRSDLLKINAEIVNDVALKTIKYSPNAIYIVLTNPLDAMAYLTMKVTDLPKERVVGQAGILDSARMRSFVARECGVDVKAVACYVLGGHGNEMVPLLHLSTVSGIPLDEFLSADKLNLIVERTRNGGAEIVDLLKTGSAYYAPAAAISQMAEAILNDQHVVLPCSAYLTGEYGINNTFFGVPVQLGRRGIEKVIDYKLNDSEKNMLNSSAESVRKMQTDLAGILKL
jgi:malate dehydrogenase